jgi:imidazolonepropionase
MTWLLTDATLATMAEGYGLIRDAAVAFDGDRIAWVGPTSDMPNLYQPLPRRSCGGPAGHAPA